MNEHQLENQILLNTISKLGEQLSQAQIDLAYVKSQNEFLTEQIQALQQALQQLTQEQEPVEEFTEEVME